MKYTDSMSIIIRTQTRARIRKIGKIQEEICTKEVLLLRFFFCYCHFMFTTFKFDMMLFIVRLKFIYRWTDGCSLLNLQRLFSVVSLSPSLVFAATATKSKWPIACHIYINHQFATLIHTNYGYYAFVGRINRSVPHIIQLNLITIQQ